MEQEPSVPRRSKPLLRDLLLLCIGILLGGVSTLAVNCFELSRRRGTMKAALLLHVHECGCKAESIKHHLETSVIPDWQQGLPETVKGCAKIDTSFWHSICQNPDQLPSTSILLGLLRFYMRAEHLNSRLEGFNKLQSLWTNDPQDKIDHRLLVLQEAWLCAQQCADIARAASITSLEELPQEYTDRFRFPEDLVPALAPPLPATPE